MMNVVPRLTLTLFPDILAVCRLDADVAVPPWSLVGPFTSITRTPAELSIICLQNGTETAGNERYLKHPIVFKGLNLELDDYEHLCVHARFCMRAGGVWNLTENSNIPEARETAIEDACNCPSGRLVIRDRKTGKPIEPDLEKSIVVIEYPARGEHGPLWVRGGIPVISYEGKPYTVRNRLTLCRCGRSHNKPFCDGSHVHQ